MSPRAETSSTQIGPHPLPTPGAPRYPSPIPSHTQQAFPSASRGTLGLSSPGPSPPPHPLPALGHTAATCEGPSAQGLLSRKGTPCASSAPGPPSGAGKDLRHRAHREPLTVPGTGSDSLPPEEMQTRRAQGPGKVAQPRGHTWTRSPSLPMSELHAPSGQPHILLYALS